MRLLIDVDALCKLAHWALLEEIPSLSGFLWDECTYLASAKYRARRSATKPDGRAFRTTEAANEVLRVIGLMGQPLDADASVLPDFQDVAGIDAGEAVLLSTLASSGDSVMLTGDKRSIRALAALDTRIRKPFSGRLIVVEQIIAAALDANGLDWLRERVCKWKIVDTAVSNIMGSRCDASEASVRAGLDSYIGELGALCEPSLLCARLPGHRDKSGT